MPDPRGEQFMYFDKSQVKVKYYIHERTFKERLKNFFINNQKSSVRWQLIRLLVRFISCVLYVIRAMVDRDPSRVGCDGCPIAGQNSTKWCCPTYAKHNHNDHMILLWVKRPIEIWGLQVAVAFFVIMDGLLTAFLNYKGSFLTCLNRYMIVDIITGAPYVISIFLPDLRNITTLTFLHCWGAKNSLETLLNDLHRKKLKHHSALSQKMLIVAGSVVCLIYTSVCGIQHLERAHNNWTMFQSLWFVVVTFSTVGYGDLTPDDWIARTWVMIMIVLALMILPGELEELAFLLVCKQKEGTVYSRVLGGERHVVVCATNLRPSMMIDFLNEFYAETKNQDVQVVLLSPSDITSDLRILLQVPLWAQRVTYLKGSVLNDEDLERAKVIDAAGVFILSDRSNPDIDAADHHTIMRTWAIQDFAPATPLFVQILKPENKFHVSFAEHVVCEHEIKHAMLASNCVCPGISTLVTLLLHTLREQKGSSTEKWQDMYGRCAGNEIYHIVLGDSKMFRRYAYKSFTHAAYHSFRRYGVTLIGVRTAAADSPILLNPGPSYHLAYDDICFYIAITSEEDMALEELKKGEGTKKRELKREQQWGSFISVIDHNEEDRAVEQAVELRRQEENSETMNGSLPKVTKSDEEPLTESPTKSPHVASNSDESELPFPVSDLSDVGSEQDVCDGSMPIHSVPKYQIGVPNVTAYVGRTPLKCHLLPEPKPFCCLELTRICSHSKGEDLSKRLSGAVIVASPSAGAGLYNFILPLRAYYRPKCTLKPLVLLLNEKPGQSFLEAVCSFPLVYFSVGHFQNVDDLLRAGILDSEKVVLTDQSHVKEYSYNEEEYMVDSYTLVGVQTIFRLFPKTFLIIELSHPTNMKFVKFDVDISSLQEEAKGSRTSLRHTIKRRYKESQARKDHLSYMFREPFAAGNVFSASMIDTLLYQTFAKDYMITLIAQLLGCEQASGSGYLTQMVISGDKLWIGDYGRLFQRLCTTTYDIPIGLYRTIKEHGRASAFGKMPEDRDIYGIVANRLKRLGLRGQPDMSSRPSKSCSIVNPPPDFQLEEGDLIYLIRRSPIVSTSSELAPPQMMSTAL